MLPWRLRVVTRWKFYNGRFLSENLPKLPGFRVLGVRGLKINFSIFTAKGTSLGESTSIKPFCIKIGWRVWPPPLSQKNKGPPLEWEVAVNTVLRYRMHCDNLCWWYVDFAFKFVRKCFYHHCVYCSLNNGSYKFPIFSHWSCTHAVSYDTVLCYQVQVARCRQWHLTFVGEDWKKHLWKQCFPCLYR